MSGFARAWERGGMAVWVAVGDGCGVVCVMGGRWGEGGCCFRRKLDLHRQMRMCGDATIGVGKGSKYLAGFAIPYIFALLSRKPVKRLSLNAALVNRLRRLPFTEE